MLASCPRHRPPPASIGRSARPPAPTGGARVWGRKKSRRKELYHLVHRFSARPPPLAMSDLLTAAPGAEPGDPRDTETGLDALHRTALAGHWRHALEQAAVL